MALPLRSAADLSQKGRRDRDRGKRRVILTEHREVNSESRRTPAVSVARAPLPR